MLRIALVFAICLLASFLVYRRAPIQFLRAESGLYLSVSHSDVATQKRFTKKFFTESYGGHYTPFAFLAEFETARRVGTSRSIWRWRQIIAVAMVAALSFTALSRLTATMGARPRDRVAIAISLAALAAFQPAMVDLVGWPFMIMQLLWLALLMVALYCITQTVVQPTRGHWPWLAAAAAYASMHISGLGLVTVVAVAAALLMQFVQAGKIGTNDASRSRKQLAAPLATLLLAAAIHATAMIALVPKDEADPATPTVHGLAALKLALGFAFNFAFAGFRNLSLTSPLAPDVLSIAYCWPLALLLLGLLAVALLRMWRRAIRIAMGPSELTSVLVACFSAAGFLSLVALVVAREMAEAPAHQGLVPYFSAFTSMPRYVIPVTYLLLPVLPLLLMRLAKFSRFIWIGCIGLALAAAATQLEFQRGPLQMLEPATRISHRSAWRLLLNSARECRAAQLPLPNLPLGALAREFSDTNVESFLPLLRHDLQLRPEESLPLVELPRLEANDLQRYDALPSLKKLRRQLDLVPPHG
jgi:hypothetical protein